MFENLDWKQITWPREPVLILGAIVAILNIVISVLTGDVTLITGIETILGILLTLFARKQVTPVKG